MKRFFLFLIIGLVLVNFSYASYKDKMIAYYDFDESSGAVIDRMNGYNMTISSGTPLRQQQGITVNDYAIRILGNSGTVISVGDSPLYNTYNLTVCANVYIHKNIPVPAGAPYNTIFRHWATDGNAHFIFSLYYDSINPYGMQPIIKTDVVKSSYVYGVSNYWYQNTSWNMYCQRYNGTTLTAFVNYTEGLVGKLEATGTLQDSSASLHIGDPSGNYFDGKIDDIMFWNRSLTDAEIQDIYNFHYNSSMICDFTNWDTCNQPTLLLNSSLKNTSFINYPNLTIGYNASMLVSANNSFNCYLRNSTTVLYSAVNVNMANNNLFNITFPENDATYYLNIFCNNSETYNTTASYEYKVDLIEPYIFTNFVNNTMFSLNTSFLLDVNITDQNLYFYNITYRKDGVIWKNDFKYNTSDFENYQYLLLNNETGNFSNQIESYDSHTKEELTALGSVKDDRFDYKGVKYYCDNQGTITFIKEKDRLKPYVTFKTASKNNKCYWINEDNDFIKVNAGYRNHYISISKQIWIDEPNNEVTSTFNKGMIELNINSKNAKGDFLTDSIGDLNYNSVTYDYQVYYNATPVTPPSSNITYTNATVDLSGVTASINNLSEAVNMIGYALLLILNMIISFLLLTGKLDLLYAFFNGLFSLVLVLLFWVSSQILAYLCLLVLLTNMFMFFKQKSGVGKVY